MQSFLYSWRHSYAPVRKRHLILPRQPKRMPRVRLAKMRARVFALRVEASFCLRVFGSFWAYMPKGTRPPPGYEGDFNISFAQTQPTKIKQKMPTNNSQASLKNI